jgi:hypothetical protein
VALDDIELIPAVELAPFDFAADGRSAPSGAYADMPEAWSRYWRDALADSGIGGLAPLHEASWYVPTSVFTDAALLGNVLEVIFRNLPDQADMSDRMPLTGGLALRCRSEDVLIEPSCCGDLGNLADWRDVVGYRRSEWRMLWIGHPWLSVRYQAPGLIVSEPHESEDPTARWSVDPEALRAAVDAAETELARFAGQIAEALPSTDAAHSRLLGRRLAGLDPQR